MGQGRSGKIYYCEDVSSITRKGDTFFLTDRSGDVEICRAMHHSTFARCVRGAYAELLKFEQERGSNVVGLERAAH